MPVTTELPWLNGKRRPSGHRSSTEVGVVEVESGTCLVVDPTFHRDGFYDADQVERAVLDALDRRPELRR